MTLLKVSRTIKGTSKPSFEAIITPVTSKIDYKLLSEVMAKLPLKLQRPT